MDRPWVRSHLLTNNFTTSVQSLPIKTSNFRLGLLIRSFKRRARGENSLFAAKVGVESARYSSRPCSPRSELRTRQHIASWSGEVLQMTSDLPPAWGDLNCETSLKLPVLKPNPFFSPLLFFFRRAIRRICLLLHTKTGTSAAPIICTWTVLFYSSSYRGQERRWAVIHFVIRQVQPRRGLKADTVPGYHQYISGFLMQGIEGGKWHWVRVWYFGCALGKGEDTLCIVQTLTFFIPDFSFASIIILESFKLLY